MLMLMTSMQATACMCRMLDLYMHAAQSLACAECLACPKILASCFLLNIAGLTIYMVAEGQAVAGLVTYAQP